MMECIFSLDYEMYGNGEGSLRELVYEPAEKIRAIFKKWNASCVIFVEAAELEILRLTGTDPAIDLVEQQIREFYKEGFEIGLHIHPQWYNARNQSGIWLMDYSEYNLATLSAERIRTIIMRAIQYIRKVIEDPTFVPISFRAGNWLFQPTEIIASVLAEYGVRIDSSVYKGGVQRQHRLDYRRALKNGYYWSFTEDVNVPDT